MAKFNPWRALYALRARNKRKKQDSIGYHQFMTALAEANDIHEESYDEIDGIYLRDIYDCTIEACKNNNISSSWAGVISVLLEEAYNDTVRLLRNAGIECKSV